MATKKETKQEDVDLQQADEQQKIADEKKKEADKKKEPEKPPTHIVLYTTLDEPRGKRFRPVNTRSGLPDYNREVILYPTKPTKVPVDTAEILLEQDAHLISKEPYSEDKDPVKMHMKKIQEARSKRLEAREKENDEKRKAADARFKRKKLSKEAKAERRELPPANKIPEKVLDGEDFRGKYIDVLAALAEKKIGNMKPTELKEFAGKLDLKLQGNTKKGWIAQLEARASYLTDAIREQMKRENKS